MHIPDGYLAPAFSVGMGVITVPAWVRATRTVRGVLNQRTVPLLAIFAALCFTIMMFNVPVPGGTTAHGVGGTLVAIVLGPSAAVIVVSTALIIQALFFGDGGVLSIFANCFNMGVALPVVGYYTYRLVARNAPLLSTRRVWAAGIAAYVGITVAALLVGIELGLQPLLFSADGRPLYSPYGLEAAVPAMLLAHMFGASLVEGIITALGFAYLQQHHADLLESLRGVVGGGAVVETGHTRPRPVWQLAGGGIVVLAVVLLVAGLITGGGNLSNAFGADWSSVDWPSVATMFLGVAVLAAILIPLAWFGLPRGIRAIGTAYVAVAIVTPVGLVAPGFAYGEGGTGDLQQELGYVPPGLQDLSGRFSAPFSGYNVPLPFFSGDQAPLWHTAIGYELAGLIGMLLLGVVVWGLGRLLARGTAGADRPKRGHVGWLEHSLAGVAGSIERAVFTEELARQPGWLQRVDPRAKVAMFVIAVLAASVSTSLGVLIALYVGILGVARASRLPFDVFVKRVWLGIPLFAGIVILPSIFFVPGDPLVEFGLGSVHLGISAAGLWGAVIFVARVGVSVSLAVLLVLTTPWADVLKSLLALKVPQVFVLVLSMTYRYIFLFLHTLNGMFEARKSRVVARLGGGEDRRWITRSMGVLLSRSFKMSNDVYAAMLARGFTGEIRTYSSYRMQASDWRALAATLVVAALSVPVGRWLA